MYLRRLGVYVNIVDGNTLTLGAALRVTAARLPNKCALVYGRERVSFSELDARVDTSARLLLSRGVTKGDTVAVWLANDPAWVALWFAAARVGAVLVPINTRYKADEAAYILKKSEAKLLVVMASKWSIDYLALLQDIMPDLAGQVDGELRLASLPELRSVLVLGDIPDALDGAVRGLCAAMDACTDSGDSLLRAEQSVVASDPVIIVFTSGTTGRPKGAVHSHVSLKNAGNIARCLSVSESDVIMGHMPFYHVAGAFSAVLPAILLGATLVIVDHWDASAALALIARERISYISGIPTHFIDLLDAMRRAPVDTSSLRTAWIGGATVTPQIVEAVVNELGLHSLQAVYGMTETTSSTTLSGYGAPLQVVCDNKGKRIGDFEVGVFSPEGRPLPLGSVGEVWVRGHIVMLEYYKDPVATAEVMTPDGWFKTGDLGVLDNEGYLQITGRAKEMFIVGGSNAYPAEIERIIQEHPLVKQVVVVGVPDDRLGEVGYAFVQATGDANLTSEALVAWCRQRMADYKVPRHVEIVADFPRTTTGKIQRGNMKDLALDRLAT